MVGRIAVLLLLFAGVLQGAEIKGKVTNVLEGEALGRVQVIILETGAETNTSDDGTFAFQNLSSGNYTLRVNAVGYRLLAIPFSLSSSEQVKEFSLTMVPDNFRRTDTVEVRGDVFQGADPVSVNEMNLTSSEIKESSTVFADDPFRAIQSLPGVSAAGNNELLAEFSVMGAPFENVGVYIDDVLVPRPFHNIENVENGSSLSLLTSETVEEMKLFPVAYPEKFGDDAGAALDIRIRDGSRSGPLFRASLGMADSDFLGEGALGHSKRGSWMASARKSYLGYLLQNSIGSDFSDVSFYDGDLKLTYDVTPNQNLNFYSLAGHTNVDVTGSAADFTPDQIKNGTSDFYFSRLGWRWGITPRLLLDSRAAYIRQPLAERNFSGQLLNHDSYGEWVGGSNVTWNLSKDHVLQGGWTLRRLQDSFVDYFPEDPARPPNASNRAGLRGDGFVQESSSFLNNRVHIFGGARWDGEQRFLTHPFSPQISMTLQALSSTQLQFGFGRYNQFQFPDFQSAPGACPFAEQEYQRANQYTAAVEQRFGENTRLRAEVFDRQTDDIAAVQADPACPSLFVGGAKGTATLAHRYSRGAQLILQRRSANRLSGWIGYTLVFARQSDYFLDLARNQRLYSPYYTSQDDQRHSLNAFATYRLTPSVNLSGKALYGSGFPESGGFTSGANGLVALPVQRIGPYERLDLRADKCWAFKRWKLTLYGEVLNLTNHDNRIINGFGLGSGAFVLDTQRALPITPTAGLVFEF